MPSTTYDLVVGADGVHSTLRTAIAGDDSALRRSAMTGSSWRFVGANPGVDCWTVWSGAAATLLLIPVGDGDVYGYASSTRGGATGDNASWLADAFAGFAGPVTDVIASLLSGEGQLHHSLVEEVRLPTWHRDRLVLIGDAAHATGPVSAQGAAMAMEDAVVLADVLAATSDWSMAGETYERARRARVDHVQTVTDRMPQLDAACRHGSRGLGARSPRRAGLTRGLRQLHSDGPLASQVMARLSWSSVLSAGGRGDRRLDRNRPEQLDTVLRCDHQYLIHGWTSVGGQSRRRPDKVLHRPPGGVNDESLCHRG